MAFLTLVPPAGAKFAPGTSESHQPRVNTAQFGNGYQQISGDGLNYDPIELRAVWNVLTWAEAGVLMTFFANHRGYIPFKFALPGETAKTWIASNFTRTWTSEKTVDVTATLKQDFTPE